MNIDHSTLYDPHRRLNLLPAKDEWRRAARLAQDASRCDNLILQREAVRIAQSAIARIGALVEAAAGRQEVGTPGDQC